MIAMIGAGWLTGGVLCVAAMYRAKHTGILRERPRP